MKALVRLASALAAAGIFGLALVALGVFCVLGAGMAAAACDMERTSDVAATVKHVLPEDNPPHSWPGSVALDRSLSAAEIAYELDLDSSTAEPSPPRSVPVL